MMEMKLRLISLGQKENPAYVSRFQEKMCELPTNGGKSLS
jgi:hypothetical protein